MKRSILILSLLVLTIPDAPASSLPSAPVELKAEVTGAPVRGGDRLVVDAPDLEGYVDMVCDPAGILFVAVESMLQDYVRIYRSADGGESWTMIHEVQGSSLDVHQMSMVVTEQVYGHHLLLLVYAEGDYWLVRRINLLNYSDASWAYLGPDDPAVPAPPRIAVSEWDQYGLCDVYVRIDQLVLWGVSDNLVFTVLDPTPAVVGTIWQTDLCYANDTLYYTRSYVLWMGENRQWPLETCVCRYAGGWDTPQIVSNGVSGRIAAIQGAADVVVVTQEESPANDFYIEYAYSTNGGDSWTTDLTLDHEPGSHRESPDIDARSPDEGFHVIYGATGGDLLHRHAAVGALTQWSPPRVINDGHLAHPYYWPAAVAVDAAAGCAGVVWTDLRGSNNSIYFDRTDGPLTVCAGGGAEYETIQGAIDAASEDDEILLCDGVYTGPGNRDLDFHGKEITVRSAGGDPELCTIDCQGSPAENHRAFHFHSGEGSASGLRDVTLAGGYHGGGGAILCDGASPWISGCVFRDNASTGSGVRVLHIPQQPCQRPRRCGGARLLRCLRQQRGRLGRLPGRSSRCAGQYRREPDFL